MNTQCSLRAMNLKLQTAVNETHDAALRPSLHDEGGVYYISMGNINATEQRMGYILQA